MTTIAIRPPMGPQPGARGPAFGIGLSLLVHAAVLAWLMHVPAPRPPAGAPAAPLQIWLAPPRPAQPVQPETPVAPALPRARAAAPASTRARGHAPEHATEHAPEHAPAHAPEHTPERASETPAVITAPPASTRDTFAVPQAAPATPDAGTDAAPTVDIAAARQAARRIAHEESSNMVVLPKRKPVVDPNADRQVIDPIENARRSDCKTAYAGMGLLAVIPLVVDAVRQSGCKW